MLGLLSLFIVSCFAGFGDKVESDPIAATWIWREYLRNHRGTEVPRRGAPHAGMDPAMLAMMYKNGGDFLDYAPFFMAQQQQGHINTQNMWPLMFLDNGLDVQDLFPFMMSQQYNQQQASPSPNRLRAAAGPVVNPMWKNSWQGQAMQQGLNPQKFDGAKDWMRFQEFQTNPQMAIAGGNLGDLWKIDAQQQGINPNYFDTPSEYVAFKSYQDLGGVSQSMPNYPGYEDFWKAEVSMKGLDPDMFNDVYSYLNWKEQKGTQDGAPAPAIPSAQQKPTIPGAAAGSKFPDFATLPSFPGAGQGTPKDPAVAAAAAALLQGMDSYWKSAAQLTPGINPMFLNDDFAKQSATSTMIAQGLNPSKYGDDVLKAMGYQSLVTAALSANQKASAGPAAAAPGGLPARGRRQPGLEDLLDSPKEMMQYGELYKSMGGTINADVLDAPAAQQYAMMQMDGEEFAQFQALMRLMSQENANSQPTQQQFDPFLFDGKLKNFFIFKQFMDILGSKAKQGQVEEPMESETPSQMGFEAWLLDGAHTNGQPPLHFSRGSVNVPGLSPSAALFGILDNLNGDQRDFMIVEAILNGQVSQMMTPILLEEIDNSKLRDMLRAQLAQHAPSASQPNQPRAASAGNGLPYMMFVDQMKEGRMKDMMLFQGMINGKIPLADLPTVLKQMDSDAMEKGLQLWAAQQNQPAAQAETGNARPATRGADPSNANNAAQPNTQMSPAVFMQVLNNADGDMKDILISQAVMQDQVPQYMFPSLLELMDNSDIAQNLLIFKVQKQASDQPAVEETRGPRGAAVPTQSLLNNPAALMPMLKQMDNGDMRDMLIAQMVLQNKVDPASFPLLMEEVDNGNLRDQLSAYMLTKGSQGGLNPGQIGFASDSVANFYAQRAIMNSKEAHDFSISPMLDSKARTQVQRQLVGTANGVPLGVPGVCGMGMFLSVGQIYEQFPMMLYNGNCGESDMTDCCDDVLAMMATHGGQHPRGPMPGIVGSGTAASKYGPGSQWNEAAERNHKQ